MGGSGAHLGLASVREISEPRGRCLNSVPHPGSPGLPSLPPSTGPLSSPPAVYKFKGVLPFCLGQAMQTSILIRSSAPGTSGPVPASEGHRDRHEAGWLSPTPASIIYLRGIVFSSAHGAHNTGLLGFFLHLVPILSICSRAHQRKCWDHLRDKSQKPQTNQPT